MTIADKIQQETLLHYATYIDLKKDPHTSPLARHLARLDLLQTQYIAERALEQLDKLITDAGD
jgi:hypothetical protein